MKFEFIRIRCFASIWKTLQINRFAIYLRKIDWSLIRVNDNKSIADTRSNRMPNNCQCLHWNFFCCFCAFFSSVLDSATSNVRQFSSRIENFNTFNTSISHWNLIFRFGSSRLIRPEFFDLGIRWIFENIIHKKLGKVWVSRFTSTPIVVVTCDRSNLWRCLYPKKNDFPRDIKLDCQLWIQWIIWLVKGDWHRSLINKRKTDFQM